MKMQRLWAFLHLILLLTSVQGNTGKEKSTTSKSTVSATTSVSVGVSASTTNTSVTSGASDLLNVTNGRRTDEEGMKVFDILLSSVQDLKVITAFVTGVVLTAVIWGLTALCCRSSRKRSVNMPETLELVSTEAQKLSGQQDETTQTPEETECIPEVEYSDIDFSAVNRQRMAEDVIRESTESEYAEIKKDPKEEELEQGATEHSEGGEEEVKEHVKENTSACEQTEIGEQSVRTEDTGQ